MDKRQSSQKVASQMKRQLLPDFIKAREAKPRASSGAENKDSSSFTDISKSDR
jgi:hypothetical protein